MDVGLPEEQITQLEEYQVMWKTFQSLERPRSDDGETAATMETRAMALVLSGCLPPPIDLQVIGESVETLLSDPAGLFPQKALTTG